MKTLFEEADVVIFDLDGTLYEDPILFTSYADELKHELPRERWTAYAKDYEKILAGEHMIGIGKVYDVLRDHVLEVNPRSLEVLQGWLWDGEPIPSESIKLLYPRPISLDFDTMISIGDGWWLPSACAKHYGAKNTQAAYERIKHRMLRGEFSLTQIIGLQEALHRLHMTKKLVLLTNAQADGAAKILEMLELDPQLFHQIIARADKPRSTMTHLIEVSQRFAAPVHRCLSIGDNYVNEIVPALKLGMQTIFIDSFQLDYPDYAGIKVTSISDTIESMMQVSGSERFQDQ